MKILIVVASARRGSSQYVAELIEKKNSISEAEINILRLSDYTIGYCTGCLECDDTHKCNINDGMVSVLEYVKAADTMIFITPARYSLVSGDGKVFIDRLNPTAVSGDIEGKSFIAIAIGQTQKEEEIDSVSLAADSLVNFAENAGLNVLGKYAIYGCYNENDIMENEDVNSICEDVGRLILRSCKK